MNEIVEHRPLGELFGELARETGTLVRQEVNLAKVEMTAKARAAGYDAVQVAAGGATAVLGALALLAAVILLLGTVIPLWASALIVGLVVSAIGAFLVTRGIRAFREIDPAPKETIRTLREDKQWLKEQVSR
jgi:hypothetical protein